MITNRQRIAHLSKPERAKLRKLAHKLWLKGAFVYLDQWRAEYERRMAIDGEVCVNKRTGEIVDCPKSKRPSTYRGL